MLNKTKSICVAGIIPLVDKPIKDFHFPWHDSLMPIARQYTALEKSLYDCASVGCQHIWIICDKYVTPIIRYRMGDTITEQGVKSENSDQSSKRDIPIYYVPLHPRDEHIGRKNVSWAIIYLSLIHI